MALFMLHTLLTLLSQFAHDIKSWRHKLKKHLLAAIPPFYGAGMGTDRTTVQWNIEKALENGNFTSCSYDVTICFFFLFFIILWNHWQPHSGALEHPVIAAMINYTFGLKELHPALRMPCEDQRSKLESLSGTILMVLLPFSYLLWGTRNRTCCFSVYPLFPRNPLNVLGIIRRWKDIVKGHLTALGSRDLEKNSQRTSGITGN